MSLRSHQTRIHAEPWPPRLGTPRASGLAPVGPPLPLPNETASSQGPLQGAELDFKSVPSSHKERQALFCGCRSSGLGVGRSGTHADADTLHVDVHEMEMEAHGLLPLPFFLRQDPLFQELWVEPRTHMFVHSCTLGPLKPQGQPFLASDCPPCLSTQSLTFRDIGWLWSLLVLFPDTPMREMRPREEWVSPLSSPRWRLADVFGPSPNVCLQVKVQECSLPCTPGPTRSHTQ